MTRKNSATAALVLSLFAGGCVNTPTGGVYTLNPESISLDHDSGFPLAIVFDYVAVPEVVDRPEFVLSVNSARVRIVETARWSKPLRTQIAAVLAVDMKRLLRDSSVFKERMNDVPIYRVAVNVRTFDLKLGEGAVLSIGWSILTPDSKHVLNGRSAVLQRVSREGFDALVDAQSRALASVSADMADAIVTSIRAKSQAPGKIFDVKTDRGADECVARKSAIYRHEEEAPLDAACRAGGEQNDILPSTSFNTFSREQAVHSLANPSTAYHSVEAGTRGTES